MKKSFLSVDPVKPLEMPDAHHLSSAVGWLGLGSVKEAREEMERIAPQLRSHPDVMRVWYEIYAKEADWTKAAETAKALVEVKSKDPQVWISLAYATRRREGGGLPIAREILRQAQRQFPKVSIIAYNLACYDCQLGDLPGARRWLKQAFELGGKKGFKEMALADADLRPLWPEMEEI